MNPQRKDLAIFVTFKKPHVELLSGADEMIELVPRRDKNTPSESWKWTRSSKGREFHLFMSQKQIKLGPRLIKVIDLPSFFKALRKDFIFTLFFMLLQCSQYLHNQCTFQNSTEKNKTFTVVIEECSGRYHGQRPMEFSSLEIGSPSTAHMTPPGRGVKAHSLPYCHSSISLSL